MNYDFPEDIHRRAKAAAALRGMTLRDWLIELVDAATSDTKSPPR
jgi:hypothetical protein